MSLIFLLQSGVSGLTGMWPLLAIMVVFWLFFIRPQNKKQKEQQKFIQEIEKGSEVCTTSGMIGKISKIEENIITLQVDTKTFIRVTRGAISKEMTEMLKTGAEA
ncbi:MAG: preprotein translocase subunit YajC [Bacteroidia bacterium]|nr:preprotein translocase subunit YajC [Bacteroidia bacterium]